MIKIAILYICTGKYNQFFADFYSSSEKYLMPDVAQKHYFVFTDDLQLSNEVNVTINEKMCEGFPLDTLLRFNMFLSIEKQLHEFDYIYFFNSNALLLSNIGTEILPTANEGNLVAACWPFRQAYMHFPFFYPYERNKRSLAYITPFGRDFKYYMGGINGGKTTEYLKMVRELADNIMDDYSKNIIAKAHDESHLNKYFRTNNCKELSKVYCIPEEWINGFEAKIMFRNKSKVDIYFDKGRKKSLLSKLNKFFLLLYNAITWYL